MTTVDLKRFQILQQLIELSLMGDGEQLTPEQEAQLLLVSGPVKNYLWMHHSNVTHQATTVIGVIAEMIENLAAFGDVGVFIEEQTEDGDPLYRTIGFTDVQEAGPVDEPCFVFQFDENDYVEQE